MDHQAPPYYVRRAAVICDVEGGLLRSSSCFPYFMLVALEAGGLLRGLLLILLHPLLSLLSEEISIRTMTLISFCGLRVCNFNVGTAVLPKYFLEDVGKEGLQLLMKGKRKVCVTRMPKVMVEELLRKYLGVDMVVAREMKIAFGFYTGLMEEKVVEEEILLERELSSGVAINDGNIGLSAETRAPLHPLVSRCKDVVLVSKAEKAAWRPLPMEEYPKPLIFHDGRIAFRPTPISATAMYIWVPFGCFLAFLRVILFLCLPFGLSTAAMAFTGMKNRLVLSPFIPVGGRRGGQGRLFICNHRTQLDPIFVSGAIGSRMTFLVYGISVIARILAPMKTVVLRRVKEEDRVIMAEELRRGDVVLCPEGTTCREPFVLRFSPLFAELVEEVHPVAMSSYGSMFYGTTASGTKALDPFITLANPYTFFTGEFLEPVPAGPDRNSRETANRAQRAIASALGFRHTMLTRKDKYMYLAGYDGVVGKRA